jgi:flagellar biosynthetic protein FliR
MAHPPSSLLAPLVELYADQLVISLLVLTRLGGLMMAAPVIGSHSVPVRLRALLVLALTLMIAPLQWAGPWEGPHNMLQLLILVAQETLVGLALGLGITVLLLGVQMAGQIAGHMSGMAMADIFDPTFNSNVPIFSQLLDVVTMLLFVAIGGHRLVVDALLETFQWMPPGEARISPDALDWLVEIVRQSFQLGIRAAAPMIVALLMSMLVMGLVSRTLPQLNILAVGLSLNAMVMLSALAISLGTIVWLFPNHVEPTIQAVWNMFVASGS